MTHWKERHTVVLAAFLIVKNDQNEILLMKRAGSYMNGFFGLPSGHADGDEEVIVAACREAHEEIGIQLTPEDLRLVHVVHEMADGHERINLGFEVTHYAGEVYNAEPEKCSELRWCGLDNLPENTVPAVRKLLENIEAGLPYSGFNWQ